METESWEKIKKYAQALEEVVNQFKEEFETAVNNYPDSKLQIFGVAYTSDEFIAFPLKQYLEIAKNTTSLSSFWNINDIRYYQKRIHSNITFLEKIRGAAIPPPPPEAHALIRKEAKNGKKD